MDFIFIDLFLLKNKHTILVIIRLNEFWRLKKSFPKMYTSESKQSYFTCKITKLSDLPEN